LLNDQEDVLGLDLVIQPWFNYASFRLVFGMLLGFLLENGTHIVKTHEIILENYTAVSEKMLLFLLSGHWRTPRDQMPCEKIEGIDAL
jgi:hypothetical protein